MQLVKPWITGAVATAMALATLLPAGLPSPSSVVPLPAVYSGLSHLAEPGFLRLAQTRTTVLRC